MPSKRPGKAKASITPKQSPSTKKTKSARTKAPIVKPPSKSKATASKPKAAKAKKFGKFQKVSPQAAQEMLDLLCKRYPDADCELTFDTDFQLLTAVILSAQTTDANVNRATPGLFARFPTAEKLTVANPDEVKELIKSTGYYNAKARSIQACAQSLVQNFGGKVPNNLEDLVTLTGVGRKTANVVLGVIHKVPGWTVDTHVQRLAHRLGLTAETDPTKIEMALQKLFPAKDWTQYSITLIWHGRRTCYARNPDCPNCPINHLCPSSSV